jgi:hypothetical protein
MNEELGEERSARSNSAMVEGRESSGAVAARSTALDFDLDLVDLVFLDEDGSESESDEEAEGAGEAARPDQSNPPTFKADAAGVEDVLDLLFVEVAGGAAMSTYLSARSSPPYMTKTHVKFLVILILFRLGILDKVVLVH